MVEVASPWTALEAVMTGAVEVAWVAGGVTAWVPLARSRVSRFVKVLVVAPSGGTCQHVAGGA